MERLKQQMDFILEMDKCKAVQRQTYLAAADRKENDAEHSWHLAMMCILLSEYANEKIDVLKTVTMVLIHDIIEIDAGDTFAYDTKANETKTMRESAAAERIFGMLPENQGSYLKGLWEEFESEATPEAKFAKTLDRLQPLMLNDATNGRAWVEHGIRAEQVYKRNETTHTGSEKLWEYAKTLIEKNTAAGKLQ